MSPRAKQQQMGDISNLITDMTIMGASQQELARAVRHSMVVIDAEKHGLNYKESAIRNGIPALKEKYQDSSRGGASTIISRAKRDIRVPEERKRRASEGGFIDPETGRRVFVKTGETYVNSKGETVKRTTKRQALDYTDDAHTLVSDKGTRIERIYADHSNRMKSLANEARLASLETKNLKRSPAARETYADEVASLNYKLDRALRNRPS